VRDLGQIVADLLAEPVAATPPLEHVVARARVLRRRRRRQLTATALLAFVLMTSVAVAFEREVGRHDLRLVDETGEATTTTVVGGSADDIPPIPGVSDAPPRSSTSTTTRPASGSAPGVGGTPSQSTSDCRPAGNAAWDTGITRDRIELTTGRGTLGPAHVGVQAVVDRVNRQGGICGRTLHVRVVDEPSADAAFAVVAPTLEARVPELDAAGVPMVGGVGLVRAQYASSLAWPAGPSMAGALRSMAQHAWESGARTFGIVYDQQQLMGVEGARAFREHVRELGGATLKADTGITPGKPSYSTEANTFNDLCGPNECDFVAMVLTPETATTYINSQTTRLDGRKRGFGRLLTGGAPLLLQERFARDCGRHCDGMLLWTGFVPDVARYVQDVKLVDPSVDTANPFVVSAYVGTEVLVQALREIGGNLTRHRLRRALDDMVFRSDLVTDLDWGPTVPSQRVANTAVRAVRVTTALGSFAGFQDAGTGWRRDPRPGSFPS
jgi:ABC-type branched-subunit amino acid transport system substrate-binding protein